MTGATPTNYKQKLRRPESSLQLTSSPLPGSHSQTIPTLTSLTPSTYQQHQQHQQHHQRLHQHLHPDPLPW